MWWGGGVSCCSAALMDDFLFTLKPTTVCFPWGRVQPLTSPPHRAQVLPEASDCDSGQDREGGLVRCVCVSSGGWVVVSLVLRGWPPFPRLIGNPQRGEKYTGNQLLLDKPGGDPQKGERWIWGSFSSFPVLFASSPLHLTFLRPTPRHFGHIPSTHTDAQPVQQHTVIGLLSFDLGSKAA